MKSKVIILSSLFFLFIFFCIVWIKFHYYTVTFKGKSMAPTIENGDEIAIVPCNTINRYDIIVFKMSQGLSCKRVIGLPLETILIENDKIKINGKALQLPIPLSKASYFLLHDSVIERSLNSDEYFVIGDYPEGSYDSRLSGPISNTKIVGKVIKIYKSGSSWVGSMQGAAPMPST